MKTVQLRAGNSVELNKRVQKVVKVKTVESLDDVKPNDANLKMLLRQFLDEFGYEVMPGEVSVDITMDEHVLDFWEFALAKGYDPVTYDYLEYWERSEAYRRLEEKINELRSAQESYKESMLDGYEVLAFGKGFYIGLDNSVNNIADKFAEIVSHPVASGEALLQGIKQVYINLNEEAGKFSKDPLSYIRNAAVNKWTSLKDVYVELQELKPSQRWERIGGMVGENIIAAATSAVGGGIVGAGLKKVFIIIESKININIPIKDIDKITGNETKPPSELQSPQVNIPLKTPEAPDTPEVNKSIEGTGRAPNVVSSKTVISSEIEAKILEGQRKAPKNELIGGHSPSINNATESFAVEVLSTNADGTKNVVFTKQFPDGNISKLKKSTLFPDSWTDEQILNSITDVGNTPAISTRLRDGATWHRTTINGVEIDVIKVGNEVTSGYPTGTINASRPSGF